MVKSRGYRIELGEIEAGLYKHKRVIDAAVIPVPDELIGNRLVAFIAIENEIDSDLDEIKAILFRYLPQYMVPEKFEISLVLPKTSNGKIDRQALAEKAAII